MENTSKFDVQKMTQKLGEELAQKLATLSEIFPSDRLLTDSESLAHYGRDWTKHYDINPTAIVFPLTTDDVVSLVKCARLNNFALVPSGGRTGLSGGACAINGEIVVSFEKMARILDLNVIDQTVTVESGVVTEALQNYVKEKGYLFPIDFAARGSSQIGGNIVTNAGGVKVIRYGSTRDWVMSLKVVTGAGDVLELNKSLIKNATGFDLRHLFIGSEGTLGFVTEATLKITAQPRPLTVLVLGIPDLDSITEVFRAFRDALPLTAFEFFSSLALQHVIAHAPTLTRPFATPAPNYLLIEVENTDESVESKLLEVFESCMEKGWILDGAISQSEAQAKDFWRLREDISESMSYHMPYKNDVSVTISKVPQFLRETDEVLKQNYPDFEVVWFGHIGDGNMHINVLKPKDLSREDFIKRCLGVNQLLFAIIERLGGSVSAEHGVGLVKKAYLKVTRSEAEINLMKGIKHVFDPDGIMNPGKIFD